mgnify:CR=1 FL=1
MDESGVQLTFTVLKVIAEKDAKFVPIIVPSEKGETVTVVAAVNGTGHFIPPFVIFKGKRLSPSLL